MGRRVKYVTEDSIEIDYEYIFRELYKKTSDLNGNFAIVVTGGNFQLTFDAYQRIVRTYPNKKVVVLWLRTDRDGMVIRFKKSVPVVNWWHHAVVEQEDVKKWIVNRLAYAMRTQRRIYDETKFSYYASDGKEQPVPYPLAFLTSHNEDSLDPTFLGLYSVPVLEPAPEDIPPDPTKPPKPPEDNFEHPDDQRFIECYKNDNLPLHGLPYNYYKFIEDQRRRKSKQKIETILDPINKLTVNLEILTASLTIYTDNISYDNWDDEADVMELMHKFSSDVFAPDDRDHPYLRGRIEGVSDDKVQIMIKVIRLIDLLKKLPKIPRHLIPRFQYEEPEPGPPRPPTKIIVGDSLAASLLAAFEDTHD